MIDTAPPPPPPPNGLSEFEILSDGSMMTVRFKPNAKGESPLDQVVKVWKLGMAEMPILGAAMGNEVREIMVVTKTNEAWVQSVDDDSFEALIEEGRRLNFTRFSRYWKRQTDLLKAMGQGGVVEHAVNRAMEKVLAKTETPSA